MGAGIAQVAAAAGHAVLLYDLNEAACDKALAGIRAQFARLAEKGRLEPAQADAAGARIRAVRALADFAGAALIVEAAAERLDVKREIFATLERHVDDACLLATNTSSISITSIAAGLREPQRVAGLHFFNPAPLMALVEVVSGRPRRKSRRCWLRPPPRGQAARDGEIHAGLHREPRRAPVLRGGAARAERAGRAPASIDAVMREAGGFRMGPFELMDLIGHDVNFAVTESVFRAYFNDPRYTPSLIQQELVNAGFLGRKSGRGFYSYADGATPPAPISKPARRAGRRRAVCAGRPGRRAAGALRRTHSGRPAGRRACRRPARDGRPRIDRADRRPYRDRARRADGAADLVLVDLARDYAQASR